LDNLKRQLQWLKGKWPVHVVDSLRLILHIFAENYPKVKKEMAMKVGHEQFGPQQIGRVTRSQTRDARSPRRKGPVDYRPFFELQ
jgi:50S ribosomal subunit-associated GTPase HflX